jgi:small subunit ribosomal protein S4e
MIFTEISDKDAETKTYKVVGKKILSGKKVQINLMQGKNIISDEKVNVGDSVVLNLKDNKIVKVIPLEKNRTAFALKGKHAGSSGKIIEIMDRGGKKVAKILADDKKINVWTKNIIVVE